MYILIYSSRHHDLGRFEVEIEDFKNMRGLRIMPRYGMKNKKNRFGNRRAPIKKSSIVLFNQLSDFIFVCMFSEV